MTGVGLTEDRAQVDRQSHEAWNSDRGWRVSGGGRLVGAIAQREALQAASIGIDDPVVRDTQKA